MEFLPLLIVDVERLRRKEFTDAESELEGIQSIPTLKNILLAILNPLSVGSVTPMELLTTLHNLYSTIDTKLIVSGTCAICLYILAIRTCLFELKESFKQEVVLSSLQSLIDSITLPPSTVLDMVWFCSFNIAIAWPFFINRR